MCVTEVITESLLSSALRKGHFEELTPKLKSERSTN